MPENAGGAPAEGAGFRLHAPDEAKGKRVAPVVADQAKAVPQLLEAAKDAPMFDQEGNLRVDLTEMSLG